MQPVIHVHWLAVVAAVFASFAFGGLWYGPLFGKAWAKAQGFEGRPSPAEIARGSALNVVGFFLMAYVLAHVVEVWRPSTWNTGTDQASSVYGFFAGFFIWLGFIVPILLNGVGYERKSWKVFFIGAGYQLVSLQIMAMILAHWR